MLRTSRRLDVICNHARPQSAPPPSIALRNGSGKNHVSTFYINSNSKNDDFEAFSAKPCVKRKFVGGSKSQLCRARWVPRMGAGRSIRGCGVSPPPRQRRRFWIFKKKATLSGHTLIIVSRNLYHCIPQPSSSTFASWCVC